LLTPSVAVENVVTEAEEAVASKAKVVVTAEPTVTENKVVAVTEPEEAVIASEANGIVIAKVDEHPLTVKIDNLGLSLSEQVAAVVEDQGGKLFSLEGNGKSVVARRFLSFHTSALKLLTLKIDAKTTADGLILKVEAILNDSTTVFKLSNVESVPSSTVNSAQHSTAGNSPIPSRTSTPLSSAPDVPRIVLNDKPLLSEETKVEKVEMMNSFARKSPVVTPSLMTH
jgi:hypothetical protein